MHQIAIGLFLLAAGLIAYGAVRLHRAYRRAYSDFSAAQRVQREAAFAAEFLPRAGEASNRA